MKVRIHYDPYGLGLEGRTVYKKEYGAYGGGYLLTTAPDLSIPNHTCIDKDNWCLFFEHEAIEFFVGDEE